MIAEIQPSFSSHLAMSRKIEYQLSKVKEGNGKVLCTSIGDELAAMPAVSYTHLDVYKRQLCLRHLCRSQQREEYEKGEDNLSIAVNDLVRFFSYIFDCFPFVPIF